MKIPQQRIEKLTGIIETIRSKSRIPGIAAAVVAGGELIYAEGCGYRDLKRKQPVTPDTAYPIASTSKAINATLLGMLVDDGVLDWDAPVQRYRPEFRLKDAAISSRVTVRDLITMRTGLPRHDYTWLGSRKSRTELLAGLEHLEASCDFRDHLQYNNLTCSLAGNLAEQITGKTWETLVRQRIFQPLGMRRSGCARPTHDNVTQSYHENWRRRLVVTKPRDTAATGPAGGVIHSTVSDMARWLSFNLQGGKSGRRRLIAAETLGEIHTPQLIIGRKSQTMLPYDAAYALGWMVRHHNGHKTVTHGGYLHDVSSSVMLFPDVNLGMVCFSNFGPPVMTDLINYYIFDTLMDLQPPLTYEQKLAEYEANIRKNRDRLAAVERTPDTKPSHPLQTYTGKYRHPAYGEIEIRKRGRGLAFKFNDLSLGLKHWHYDAWVAEDDERWTIHGAHPFDRSSPIQFHSKGGDIAALSIALETAVAPIRFEK